MKGLACYIDKMTAFEKEYMTSWDGDESTERGTAAFSQPPKAITGHVSNFASLGFSLFVGPGPQSSWRPNILLTSFGLI
jgi:hypothetical protein